MKVYYSNTLKIVEDFNRTENALKTRAWAADGPYSYGYSRIPMLYVKKPIGTLETTSYDYKYGRSQKFNEPLIGTLESSSGLKWKIQFENANEQVKWEQYHLATKLVISKFTTS